MAAVHSATDPIDTISPRLRERGGSRSRSGVLNSISPRSMAAQLALLLFLLAALLLGALGRALLLLLGLLALLLARRRRGRRRWRRRRRRCRDVADLQLDRADVGGVAAGRIGGDRVERPDLAALVRRQAEGRPGVHHGARRGRLL